MALADGPSCGDRPSKRASRSADIRGDIVEAAWGGGGKTPPKKKEKFSPPPPQKKNYVFQPVIRWSRNLRTAVETHAMCRGVMEWRSPTPSSNRMLRQGGWRIARRCGRLSPAIPKTDR